MNESERMPVYRAFRTMLRNGQWQKVVDDLTELAADPNWPSNMATEIKYLLKHGQAGRLSYVQFRRLGIPLGSGAIESGIRRVINNRMKGTGMFRKAENAEIMMSGDKRSMGRERSGVAAMSDMNRTTSIHDWRWIPEHMSTKVENENSNDQKPTNSKRRKS